MQSTDEKSAAVNAVQRYRRLRTITGKAVEIAKLCGLNLNVVVYDPQHHRLKENYTDDCIKLEALHLLAHDVPNNTKSRAKMRQLKFWSIDARSIKNKADKQAKLPNFQAIQQFLPTDKESEEMTFD